MLNKIHLIVKIKHLERFIPERNRIRTFAASIGIMLRSYAQAINKQEGRKGVLWQGPTKADHYSIFDEDDSIEELRADKDFRMQVEKPAARFKKKREKQASPSIWTPNLNINKMMYRQLYTLFSGVWQKTWAIFRILLLMLLMISIELCPIQAEEAKLEKHYKLNNFLNLLA